MASAGEITVLLSTTNGGADAETPFFGLPYDDLRASAIRQEVDVACFMAPPSPHVEWLLILDRALTHLTERHPHHTRLVGMMCFGGLAEVLEFSVGIVERDWSASRPGLQSQLCNLPK